MGISIRHLALAICDPGHVLPRKAGAGGDPCTREHSAFFAVPGGKAPHGDISGSVPGRAYAARRRHEDQFRQGVCVHLFHYL
jgi:hypothetical protein